MIALVVAGALVTGISAFFARDRAATDTPEPTPSASPATAGADGCIAGRNNDAKSLVAGAREQAQTEAGAAAVAAGFLRFTYSYPWPSQEELTTAFSELSLVGETREAEDAAQGVRSNAGPESARTAGLAFADARYLVEPGGPPEEVNVSVAAQAVTDGTLNGEAGTITLTMHWDDGVWKVGDLREASGSSEVLNTGTAFVGGC